MKKRGRRQEVDDNFFVDNSNNKYFVQFFKIYLRFLPSFSISCKMERPHKFGHGKIICSADPITDVKDSFCCLHTMFLLSEGYPISPFLFVLQFDVFSRFLIYLKRNGSTFTSTEKVGVETQCLMIHFYEKLKTHGISLHCWENSTLV